MKAKAGAVAGATLLGAMLVALYLFLYSPIAYIIYQSISKSIAWPFPFKFSLRGYELLWIGRTYHEALYNSLILGVGSAVLCTIFATLGTIAVLKYRSRWRRVVVMTYLAPLFVASLLIGVSSLIFNRQVLDLPGNMVSAVIANALPGTAFAFLIMLAQLVRYDWRMDEAAMVFGARPLRCFWEITLPNIWPAMLGAFIISFILAFNNLDISFYNLGATQTLPSVAWGSLRHGLGPELPALAALVNAVVFLVFAFMYLLMRYRIVSFGHRE
jgi:ABC-type spermidine/putrescine transport system permease subunit II